MKLRLPFALGLAMASVTLAVINLWPFTPPGEGARTAASDAAGAPPELRPWLGDSLYHPLEKPKSGEWLDSVHEWPQSVKSYRNSQSNLPDQIRQVLYLLPLGEFPRNGSAPSLEVLREYLGIFFGLESRLMAAEPEAAAGAKQRLNASSGQPQLLTPDLLKWLPDRLPADAYALLAVTMTDLYPKESWNFVFGEATLKQRVGVFSLARHDPAFFFGGGGPAREGRTTHPTVQTIILRRACITLSHESGHMFGWSHCRYYQCLMGGSGGVEESDRFPTGLCPVCLHKLYVAKPFDPPGRQRRLLAFYQQHGMKEDARQAQLVLEAAGK